MQYLGTSSTEISGPLQWLNVSDVLSLYQVQKVWVKSWFADTCIHFWSAYVLCAQQKWFSACQLLKRSLDTGLCVSDEKDTCFHELFHNLCIRSSQSPTFCPCWLTSQLWSSGAFLPSSFIFYYIFHFFKFPLFLINTFYKLNQHGLTQHILKCHLNHFQIQVLIKTNLRSNRNSNPSYVMWAI